MERHHDEQIDCADCGASFVFSADEAAVFAERGLTAPKRCKDCRRARKARAAEGPGHHEGGFRGGPRPAPGGFANGNGHAGRGYDGGQRAGGFGAPRGPRRYTGDVNEYRSPMQDTFSSSFSAPPRAPRASYGNGDYRSPMADRGFGFRDGGPPRGPRRDGNSAPHDGPRSFAPRSGGEGRGSAPQRAPRSRPPAEMFSITCNSCGQNAEVPFKPAEGREVFCQTCYRARKPV